ncbi:MAG TPA: rhodanese-like domain-containing protein [Cyclobacteriaceae bacterium]|nr:rhodanese-like domain-containing protein [Cyclobacteriaceae bacterium]
MKSIFILALVAVVSPFVINKKDQKKEYVCMPCGRDCDHDTYDRPGTCSSCGMALVEKSTVKFKDLSFEQVCARLKANPKAVLLDVRTPGEFEGTSDAPSYGHFKNAININVEDLPRRMDEISKYKDQEVLVYCSHSHRSPRATYLLSTNGFKNVNNVAGGVSSITEAQKSCFKGNFVEHEE